MLVGGNLNNGDNAGLFCRNLNNALSNTNWNISARISFVYRFIKPFDAHMSLPVTKIDKGEQEQRKLP